MKIKANIDFDAFGKKMNQAEEAEVDHETGKKIVSSGLAFEVYPEPGSEIQEEIPPAPESESDPVE